MHFIKPARVALTTIVLMMCGSHVAYGAFVLPPQIKMPSFVKHPAASTDKVQIKGSATKGPIANADVAVYEIDDFGFPTGSAIATTTTDSTGNFTLSLPAFDEILLVKTAGGSFLDESDTRPIEQRRRITLASDEGFMSIIEPGQSAVAITPFTDGLVERARVGGRLGGFDDIMLSIMASSTEGFGFSLFETEPPDPANPGAATQAQLQYALLIGTVANMSNVAALIMGMPAPTFDVIKATIYDLSDGETDGLLDGRAIIVGNKTYPAIDSEQQIIRFRNNNFASYGSTPLPEWEDSELALGLGMPTFFYGVFENEDIPQQFGIAARFWAKVVLNPDGTGTLSNNDGIGEFDWAGAAGNITMDFSKTGGFQSPGFVTRVFNPTTGASEDGEVFFVIDRIDAFVGLTNTGKEALFGEIERRTIETTVTGFTQEFAFEGGLHPGVTIYDANEALPIPDPATFEADPALPAFLESPNGEPGTFFGSFNSVDSMTFNADGSGITRYEQDTFRWQLLSDGRLQLDFTNGERAVYTLITEDGPNGDFAVVDYIKDGFEFTTGAVVHSRDPDVSWNSDNVAGIIESPGSVILNGGEIVEAPIFAYLRPDGAGILEITQTNINTGESIIIPSSRTICWEIDSEGYLNRKRAFFNFPDTLPTPGQCQNLTDGNVEWMRSLDIMEQNGEEIKAVIRFFGDSNDCEFDGIDGNCNAIGRLESTFPSVQNRIHTFNANPPYTIRDFASTTAGQSVTVDVLANDRAGDNPIDPSTVEIISDIVGQDFFSGPASSATASVNASGQIVVDPGGETSGGILFNYRVMDTAGNISNTGIVSVDVTP